MEKSFQLPTLDFKIQVCKRRILFRSFSNLLQDQMTILKIIIIIIIIINQYKI